MHLVDIGVLEARIGQDDDDEGGTRTVIALRNMYGWVTYRISGGGWTLMGDEEAEEAMRQMGLPDDYTRPEGDGDDALIH